MLTTNDILKILPHKHPYLLVDRIVDIQEGERVVGIKAVSYTEAVFAGHYPQDPILPGTMIVEASSQVAGFLVGATEDLIGYVVEIKGFKFVKPVKPGCLLQIEARKQKARGPFLEASIEVRADGELMASGTLQLFIRKKNHTSDAQNQQAVHHGDN